MRACARPRGGGVKPSSMWEASQWPSLRADQGEIYNFKELRNLKRSKAAWD